MKAITAFEYNLERSRNLVRLYRELKDGEHSPKAHREVADLLRAAFVLAVGAFDAYIHDKISENFVPYLRAQLARGGDLSKYESLYSEGKPVLTVRNLLIASTRQRPFVPIRKSLDKYLYSRALQNPGVITDAGKLLGIPNIWSVVYTKVESPSESKLKKEFSELAIRRNQIVHEGDRQQAKKVKGKRRPISQQFVSRAIDRIEAVANSMNEAIDTNLSELKKKSTTE